jgi:hypothetical protein
MEFFVELLFEFLLQIVVESLFELGIRSVTDASGSRKSLRWCRFWGPREC